MEKIKKITIDDENYPFLLKQIPDPPKILYYKGIIKKEEPSLAIVGARRCSSYGEKTTSDIATNLAEAGLTVVSGLAPGIDTFAHISAIKGKGRTIAVLGTGLDEKNLYPKENIYLARKIVESGGCLLSEYPEGTRGSRFTFPRRNRIIAGLSFGVLVIESKENGGAMITADYARSYKRKLFALPGNIYSFNSLGPHKLIKSGAKLIDKSNEIIEELKSIPAFQKLQADLLVLNFSSIKEETNVSIPEEKLILKVLEKEPLHLDKIIELTKLNPAKTASVISILELKEKIRNLGSNIYTLA